MGFGFFMYVLNLSKKTVTTQALDQNALEHHGEDGSRPEYFEHQVMGHGALLPSISGESYRAQYVETWDMRDDAYLGLTFDPGMGNFRVEIPTQSSISVECSDDKKIFAGTDSNAKVYEKIFKFLGGYQGRAAAILMPDAADVPAIDSYLKPKGATQLFDKAQWMQQLNEETNKDFFQRPLHDICLPGSHDSGMAIAHDTSTMVRGGHIITQDLKIIEQLNAGIRYFDLRPSVAETVNKIAGRRPGTEFDGPPMKPDLSNDFYFGHYGSDGGGQGEKMKEVLPFIKEFVEKNTQEVLLLHFNGYETKDGKKFNDMKYSIVEKKWLNGEKHYGGVKNVPEKNIDQELLMLDAIWSATDGLNGEKNILTKSDLKGKTVNEMTLDDIIRTGKRIVCVFDDLDEKVLNHTTTAGRGGLIVMGVMKDNRKADCNIFDDYANSACGPYMICDQVGKYLNFHKGDYGNADGKGLFKFSYTVTMGEVEAWEAFWGDNSIDEMSAIIKEHFWTVMTSIPLYNTPPNIVCLDFADGDTLAAAIYFNRLKSKYTLDDYATIPAIVKFKDKVDYIYVDMDGELCDTISVGFNMFADSVPLQKIEAEEDQVVNNIKLPQKERPFCFADSAEIHVVFRDTDNNVCHLSTNSNDVNRTWKREVLSGKIKNSNNSGENAPKAKDKITGYQAGGVESVVYLDENDRLSVLTFTQMNSWIYSKIAPDNNWIYRPANSPCCALYHTGPNQPEFRNVFRDTNGQIIDTWGNSYVNLFYVENVGANPHIVNNCNEPAPYLMTGNASCYEATGYMYYIVYRRRDNFIRTLFFVPPSTWYVSDFESTPKIPQDKLEAAGDPSAFFFINCIHTIVYISKTDRKVCHLSYDQRGSAGWMFNCLNDQPDFKDKKVVLPLASEAGEIYGFCDGDYQYIYYLTENNNLAWLYIKVGGTWKYRGL